MGITGITNFLNGYDERMSYNVRNGFKKQTANQLTDSTASLSDSSDIFDLDKLEEEGVDENGDSLWEQFQNLVKAKRGEYLKRARSGSFEQKFRIGSGEYTIEEWKRMLKNFDKAMGIDEEEELDEEEALKEKEREADRGLGLDDIFMLKVSEAVNGDDKRTESEKEIEKEREEKTANSTGKYNDTGELTTASTDSIIKEAINGADATEDYMAVTYSGKVVNASELSPADKALNEAASILAETTTMSEYPAENIEDKTFYVTVYTKEGIMCSSYKDGKTSFEWQIKFNNEEEYDKVMEFLNDFDKGDNLTFAAHEDFWNDFLSGSLDVNGFLNFWENHVENGIPNYTIEDEKSMYIDEERAKYAPYFNEPGLFNMLSEEDLLKTPSKTWFDEEDLEMLNSGFIESYVDSHYGASAGMARTITLPDNILELWKASKYYSR